MKKSMLSGKYGVTAARLKNPNPIAQWEQIAGTVFRKPPMYPPTYNDPVQGACNSCYFIAALSSIAWVLPGELTNNLANIGFYANPGGAKTLVAVTNQLPTDAAHQLIYARCGDAGETWPALYEKAYAKWKDCCVNNPDHPVYENLPWLSPIEALKQILGYTHFNPTPAANYNAADIPCNAAGKTTRPSVAWTGAAVNEPGLYPNHSYSLLGKYTYGGNDYLVLRNPYGATIANSEPVANIAPGIWNGINLAAIDGVFAYKLNAFKANFTYYGSIWA